MRTKHPRQKKRLSLQRDRRNVYGENSKSSRKNIARAKQRQHMDERRAVVHILGQIKGEVGDDAAEKADLDVKLAIADSRNRGFKKIPDEPLGNIIQRKLDRRNKKGILGAKANATV